jgi:hypothetical protein
MTEAEWLTATDPDKMFRQDVLEECDDPTSRKGRLLCAACCRRLWHRISDPSVRSGIEVAELFADGRITLEHLIEVNARVAAACERRNPGVSISGHGVYTAVFDATRPDLLHLDACARACREECGTSEGTGSGPRRLDGPEPSVEVAREQRAQVSLIRDIFGNPFRPVAFNPSWRTDTVLTLARQMYASREFGAMPILADALQDAGCDNDDVLNHCRGAGPHVRGCWVIDLALDKSQVGDEIVARPG